MAKFPMFIVNETLPLVLKMNPNPNKIQIDRAKVFSKTQTLGGWVFEHWGEQPRTMKVTGKTQAVLGKGSPGQNTMVGVEAAMFALQQVYNLDKRPATSYMSMLKNPKSIANISLKGSLPKELSSTFIYYKLDFYFGFFTKFSYELSGEHPRNYDYNFEFMITASAQNTLADALFSSDLGPIAGLAQVGTSGNILEGAALLAGAAIAKRVVGIRE